MRRGPKPPTPWDPARRLNVYLPTAGDRDRFNAAAAAAGMATERGAFLMTLLERWNRTGELAGPAHNWKPEADTLAHSKR